MNLNGQTILASVFDDTQHEINVSTLPAGLYLVTIFNDNSRVTEKIVVAP